MLLATSVFPWALCQALSSFYSIKFCQPTQISSAYAGRRVTTGAEFEQLAHKRHLQQLATARAQDPAKLAQQGKRGATAKLNKYTLAEIVKQFGDVHWTDVEIYELIELYRIHRDRRLAQGHRTGVKANELIAQMLNTDFHDGQPVRTHWAIRTMLRDLRNRHHKRGVTNEEYPSPDEDLAI